MSAPIPSPVQLDSVSSRRISSTNIPFVVGILCLAYLTSKLVWKIFLYPLYFSPLRRLPSPKHPHFLAGHGSAVFGKPPGAELLRWTATIANDGLIRFRGYFNQDHLLITAPATLADVLQKRCYDFEKPPQLRSFLARVQGDGLSIVEGDQHKFQRKSLNPAFHVRQIKELYPLFWNKAQKLTEVLEKAHADSTSSSSAIEIGEYASRASMDIIGIAALGKELNTLEDPQHPVMEQFVKLFEVTPQNVLYFGANMIFPQRLIQWLPFFTKSKKTMRDSVKILRDEAHAMVKDKKRSMPGTDILSVILRTECFSENNLVDQLITFLAAGHETTANTFTWALHLLATHREIQTRLREELLSNCTASSTMCISTSTLESLPILHGVICETLRLYPGAPILLRQAVRNTVIGDQDVPKGTQIILCPWAVNRDPALWGPDADKFRPERWAEREAKTNNHGGASSNYSFLTFLQGPRRCIGDLFTRAELRCLLASVVMAFEMEMSAGKEVATPSGVVGLKPAQGVWLRLTAVGMPQDRSLIRS